MPWFIASCSFAPPSIRPPMPIPANYKETGKWQDARTKASLGNNDYWWRMYGDESLNKLEEKLTCTNQNLKIAYSRYMEARATAQVARSNLYPRAVGIANANRQETSRNVANPTQVNVFNDFLIGNLFTYEIDVWGRVRNSVIANENYARASAADLAAIALSLHAELALDYFSLRGDEAAQRVLDATVIAYQKALSLTEQRHTGGVAAIADVDQAITQLENAKTLATEMRLRRAKLEHAIAVLIGEIPANFVMPATKAPMKLISVAPELPSELLKRRPDIAAAARRVQAANAEIGVACAAFFPQFNLVSLIGFESQSLSNLISKPSLIWSLGPSNLLSLARPLASVVLFDGGRLDALLRSAKATYYENVAHYRQTVLTAFQEVEDNLVALRRLDEATQSQNAAATGAKRALIQAKNRYVGGVTNYLDVVVNENIALQAELAAINIRTSRQLASVQLIKALGGGWGCQTHCVH